MGERYYYLASLFATVSVLTAVLFALSPYVTFNLKDKTATVAEWLPSPIIETSKINLSAISFLSVFVSSSGKTKVLVEKNISDRLPIASVSKLMTAIIAFNNYHPEEIIAVSNKSLDSKGRSWKFEPGEIFKVNDLLHALLMESNNDAAEMLAIRAGKNRFVEAMNLEARNIALKDTLFVNSTGLDPDEADGVINYSTAEDLFKIARVFKEKYPSLVNMTIKKEYDLHSADGEFHHKIENTNELLSNDWQGKDGKTIKILGGKTGETPFSRQNLILIIEAPNGRGYIVNVILGSPTRFDEMKELMEWIFGAYAWEIP